MGVTNTELKALIIEQNKTIKTNSDALIRQAVVLEGMKPKVDAMHECIYGNGNPQKGMFTRLVLVEDFVMNWKKVFWSAIAAGVLGGIGTILTVVLR